MVCNNKNHQPQIYITQHINIVGAHMTTVNIEIFVGNKSLRLTEPTKIKHEKLYCEILKATIGSAS